MLANTTMARAETMYRVLHERAEHSDAAVQTSRCLLRLFHRNDLFCRQEEPISAQMRSLSPKGGENPLLEETLA